MKLHEIYGRGRRSPIRAGTKTSKVFYFELEDPNSDDYVEAAIRGYFTYDDGDVGFGVGPGRSPYPAEWEFDYSEVEEPFTFMGQQYQAGQEIDMEDFAQFMTQAQAKNMFPTDEAGEYDGGY